MDAYIAAAGEFARPILQRFRRLVHKACPRREYVAWITEAKQEATRSKRLATAIEWMAEGKPRN